MHRQVLSIVLALVATAALRAHDPGLGTVQLDLRPATLVARVGYAPGDLRTLLPPAAGAPASAWTTAYFNAALPRLRDLGPRLLELRGSMGALAWTETSVALESPNSVLFTLACARPAPGPLVLRSLVIDRLPPGHRDYISVADERGDIFLERLEGATDAPVAFYMSAPPGADSPSPLPPPPTFWGFLWLGVTHIWTGYDHLLFLFGLLVVCRSFRSIVAIISCFTVAHSITLALSTLNMVAVSSRLVEPAIAATIFYVGVENLVRQGAEPRGRWALTFAFGLVHGLGFASVLRELGVGANGHGIAVPLVTFNLGVELGQVTIAAVVLPIVWQLRKSPAFVRRGVPVLAVFVALAGLYWFLERTIL